MFSRGIIKYIFLLASSFVMAQASEGLLLDYTFDGNLDDTSGNGFHAQPFGVSFYEDRFGNPNAALYFDGIDDYVAFPNSENLKPDLPVSFSFWIKYDSESHEDRSVFNTSFEDDVSSGVYFNTQISTGNYAINFGDGTPFFNPSTRRTYTSNSNIDTLDWHFIIAIVESANNMRLYVDCRETGGIYSGTGGSLAYSSTPGNLGRRDRDLGVPPLYFKGSLDDFKYWDVALVEEEVAELCEILNLEDHSETLSVSISPNPVKSVFEIRSNQIIEKVVIYNSLGLKMHSEPNRSTIDVGHLPTGLYFAKLLSTEGITTVRFIKN